MSTYALASSESTSCREIRFLFSGNLLHLLLGISLAPLCLDYTKTLSSYQSENSWTSWRLRLTKQCQSSSKKWLLKASEKMAIGPSPGKVASWPLPEKWLADSFFTSSDPFENKRCGADCVGFHVWIIVRESSV